MGLITEAAEKGKQGGSNLLMHLHLSVRGMKTISEQFRASSYPWSILLYSNQA